MGSLAIYNAIHIPLETSRHSSLEVRGFPAQASHHACLCASCQQKEVHVDLKRPAHMQSPAGSTPWPMWQTHCSGTCYSPGRLLKALPNRRTLLSGKTFFWGLCLTMLPNSACVPRSLHRHLIAVQLASLNGTNNIVGGYLSPTISRRLTPRDN